MKTFSTIDEYIASFPGEIAGRLEQIRQCIAIASPLASEKISYGMPAFYFNGILVYFAAHQFHIGFYPTASAMAAFASQLGSFKTSKGTLQFPHAEPLPFDLIREIVLYRTEENSLKKKNRKK